MSDITLETYLAAMTEAGASDLFLRGGEVPTLRVNGELMHPNLPPPDEAAMQRFAQQVLTPIAAERFARSPDIDVAYGTAGGRFRVNLFLTQGKLALVARHIPSGAVRFEGLNLPPIILKMAEVNSGLILVVGPTGSGKTTTLAALVHQINAHRRQHIVTIEDPIEFVHTEIQSLIHQRQVGYDTESFATALRHVVRQSPDTILIGEMRDADTMDTALKAALTGHLVLSTLHSTSVVQSIDRMLNYFPPEGRRQAQADISQTLVGIISLRLLPRSDGKGRVPAVEVMRGTPYVRRLIADGSFGELYDAMKRGREGGMITLNQSLVDLVRRGVVDEADALPHSPNPDEFRLNMQGMTTGVDSISMRAGG